MRASKILGISIHRSLKNEEKIFILLTPYEGKYSMRMPFIEHKLTVKRLLCQLLSKFFGYAAKPFMVDYYQSKNYTWKSCKNFYNPDCFEEPYCGNC